MAKTFKRGLTISLGLIFSLIFYPINLVCYFYEKIFTNNQISVSIQEVYAEVFSTIDEALKVLLSDAKDLKEEIKVLTAEQKKSVEEKAQVELDPEFDKEFHFYTSSAGTAVLDTVKGKWGPIKFIMAFDKEGKIKDVVVLELKERRGRPVKERRFLDQFIGKAANEPIKLNKDIKGVSGATISSRGMSNGIRKLVYVFNELYKK
ncbi:MAG: FMN-binding protein [Candidatus Omnitrophota bacterium]